MFKTLGKLAALIGAALLAGATSVQAQVGEPFGAFGIKITQGSTTIVDNPSVTVPLDHKISDGTPEGSVPIGTLGALGTPIILKIVTDDDPSFRISHWYIDVPISTADIHSPGPTSLFNPIDLSPIKVEITGLSFTGTSSVTPLIVNNDTYAAAFMRDYGGRFYNLPESAALGFPGPATTVQVYGEKFFDANAVQYAFTGTNFLPTASWMWSALPNPGLFATVNDGLNPSVPNLGGGYVFELGLGVSFVGVPEPGTLAMTVSGLLALLARKRRVR